MKFSTVIAASAVASGAFAKDVACRVNGVQESVVDLETGSCAFNIPSALPVNFEFVSTEDYLADAYYALEDGSKYFNDIAAAGRVISIPAKLLYGGESPSLFHIHAEKTPASNSTAALRKRFHLQAIKRDAESDFIAELEATDGTAVPSSSLKFEVNEPDVSSSSSVAGGETVTSTHALTTVVTITSCSDDACSKKTETSTWGPTTVTTDEEVTVYTTWCPLSGESTATVTDESTTIITITSCSDDACDKKTKTATWGPTTETVEGEVTVYTTWCPITTESIETPAETTKSTETPAETTKSTETPAETTKTTETPATTGPEVVETTVPTTVSESATTYTTYVTISSTETPATKDSESTAVPGTSESTVAPGTSESTVAPVVSTSFNGAAKVGGSLLALIAIPAAYLL